MQINRAPVLLGGGILNDIGSGFMDVARGIVTIGNKVRGDQPNTVVQAPPTVNYMNYALYGGLALLGMALVFKKK